LIPLEVIETKIFVFRGHRVMLDRDLAQLFGVQLKRLNEQVNRDRFPEDFMFQLTLEEGKHVLGARSQIATLESGRNLKFAPHVFTEHGAVMLANVLKSRAAVRASIQVVRAFVRLRQTQVSYAKIAKQIHALENRVGDHDAELQEILYTLERLLSPPLKPKRAIGFGR
jgi:predicted ATP-grasp superfamily ATP-dependent carboligase